MVDFPAVESAPSRGREAAHICLLVPAGPDWSLANKHLCCPEALCLSAWAIIGYLGELSQSVNRVRPLRVYHRVSFR
jgi:hypothetical protein